MTVQVDDPIERAWLALGAMQSGQVRTTIRTAGEFPVGEEVPDDLP